MIYVGLPPPLPSSIRTDIEELRERCRTYEFALRKIATEEPNSSAASLAAAALRLFE
jgi:hypothetical protein